MTKPNDTYLDAALTLLVIASLTAVAACCSALCTPHVVPMPCPARFPTCTEARLEPTPASIGGALDGGADAVVVEPWRSTEPVQGRTVAECYRRLSDCPLASYCELVHDGGAP